MILFFRTYATKYQQLYPDRTTPGMKVFEHRDSLADNHFRNTPEGPMVVGSGPEALGRMSLVCHLDSKDSAKSPDSRDSARFPACLTVLAADIPDSKVAGMHFDRTAGMDYDYYTAPHWNPGWN
jgi:hypothetical protein